LVVVCREKEGEEEKGGKNSGCSGERGWPRFPKRTGLLSVRLGEKGKKSRGSSLNAPYGHEGEEGRRRHLEPKCHLLEGREEKEERRSPSSSSLSGGGKKKKRKDSFSNFYSF